MAFVKNFKYDMFLSYAWADNAPRLPSRPDTQWVDSFRECLTTALDKKLGRKGSVGIFWDRKDLKSNSPLTPEIQAAIEGSAVFVAIMSPAYLHPDCYCRKEREWFLKRLGDTHEERAAQRRAWIVHVDEVAQEIWQAAFYPDVLGKTLYDKDQEGKARLHLLGSDPKKDQVFLDRIEDLASEIAERLKQFVSPPPPPPPDPPIPDEDRMVYLADCTPESEMARRILKEFLISKGWRVLPEREYSKETYADEARQDLQRALAFVQLLGEFRWRFGEFDVIQYRLAQELNIPMFRQRNPDLDLTRVEEEHRAFITGPGVVARGLEEFKDIVDRGLREKRRANLHAHHPPSPFARVLTSLRARAGDALWDQAFARCRENNVLLERVSGEEKLKDLCAAMPCHGFLLLCDEGAVADEALSNKPRLRECFAIQLEAATPPPVGVMFWPPPDQPPWSRLLPCSPEKLHCINGQMPDEEVRLAVSLQPTNLTTFVTEVRKLAS